MSKLYLTFLILLLLFPTFALAENYPISSPDFTYKIQKYSNIKKDTENLNHVLDQFFESRELKLIYLPDGFNETKFSLSKLDRIYSGDLGNTVVMIKSGIMPSDDLLMNKPVQLADGYLEHFSLVNGLVTAVFVKTENWDNANEIFTNLKLKLLSYDAPKKNPNTLFQFVVGTFINSVYADTLKPCNPHISSEGKGLNTLNAASNAIVNESSPIQHVSACALSAVKGVWDGSGGAVVGAAKGIGEFISSPIESGKKFWEGASKLWDGTKKFFNDFELEARKLYAGFDSLDPIIKTKIACQVIGTIGGAALLTYFTAGIMTAGATELILLKIKNAIQSTLSSVKFENVKNLLSIHIAEIDEFEMEMLSHEHNLTEIPRGSPAASIAENKQVLAHLKNMPIEAVSSKRKAGLSNDEIQQLYREISDHPVVSLSNVSKYDKSNKGLGYCFGRATAAHLKAILKGADKNSIRKIWAVGDLQSPGADWRYHVATIVRDAKGNWIAIDPIMGKPMSVDKWYAEMKKSYDSTGNMKIIDTEAKRFGPELPDKYSPKALNHRVFEDYFKDLMKSLREDVNEMVAETKGAK